MKKDPFKSFQSSPEIIRLVVMMYVRFPLSLRNVEDLLHERGIDISHETVWYWWNRFGPMFAAENRRKVNQTGFTGEPKARKVSYGKRQPREPFFDRGARACGAHGL